MYSFQKKGEDYYFYHDGVEMQTPASNAFKTNNLDLATKLIDDLNEFGDDPYIALSILTYQYSFIDFFDDMSSDYALSAIHNAYNNEHDWTFDLDLDEELQNEYYRVFGTHPEQTVKAQEWIRSLNKHQLCAVRCFSTITGSLNIAYIVGTIGLGDQDWENSETIEDVISLIDESDECDFCDDSEAIARWIKNYIFYLNLNLETNDSFSLKDDGEGEVSKLGSVSEHQDFLNFPFHKSALLGDYQWLSDMLNTMNEDLSEGILNNHDSHGWSPLHYAARKGHKKIVNLMVQKGANPSLKTRDNNGYTPLYISILSQNTDTSLYLIDLGFAINDRGESGFTPLHEAVRLRDYDVVNALLNKSADVNAVGPDNSTPLCWAVVAGEKLVVSILLDNGADSDVKGIMIGDDESMKVTPIYFAAASNNTEIFKLLLHSGADINFKGPGEYTCLHEVARNGNLEITKLCLDQGLCPLAEAADGTTARSWSDYMKHVKVSAMLRDAELAE